MNKISTLFIGNSHNGPFGTLWRDMAHKPTDVEIDFLCAPGPEFKNFAVEGSRLRATSSRLRPPVECLTGTDSVDTQDYDLIIINGFGMAMNVCRSAYKRKHRLFEHLDGKSNCKPISRPCIHQAIVDSLDGNLGIALANRIRTITANPIIIIPKPITSARIMEGADHTWARSVPPEVWRELYALYAEVCTEVCQQQGFQFFAQPLETFDEVPAFTDSKFDISYGLSVDELAAKPHVLKDFSHMSQDYGRIALPILLETIRSNHQN